MKLPKTARMQDPHTYNLFDKDTTRYDELSKILKDYEHLFEWKSGEKILDAGCGPGDVTTNVLLPWLPSDIQSLLGIDVSLPMLNYALVNHSSDKVSYTMLDMCLDASENLQSGIFSEGFDKIFSFYVLLWIENIEKGLKTLYKLLKPGGQIFLVFPVGLPIQKAYINVGTRQPWSKYLKDVSRRLLEFPGEQGPSSKFQEMMLASGFEVSLCECLDHSTTYNSVDILKGLIATLDHHIGCVPTDMKEQYLNDCIQELKNMNTIKVHGQKISLKYNMIIALAKKPGF